MKTIADRVRAIVTKHATNGGYHALPTPLVDSQKFLSDLRMDSLDLVELTMSIEDEFHIKVPDDLPPTFKTTADVIAYVQNVVPAAPAPQAALPAEKIAQFVTHVRGGSYATQIEFITEIVRMTEVEHGITSRAAHA